MSLTVDTLFVTADGGIAPSARANLGDLKGKVVDYLDRPDLTDRILTFVGLFEAKLNRLLRAAGNESVVTLTPDAVTGAAALPANYKEWRAVTAPNGGALRFLTPSGFNALYTPLRSGAARAFTIVGTTLYIAPLGQSVTLDYYRGVEGLYQDSASNWLLDDHADLYLYGTLAEAEVYLKNDARMATWQRMAADALTDLLTADRSARWGRAAIRTMGATP